jgi:hypothetical protein
MQDENKKRKYFLGVWMLFDMDEAQTDMRFNPQKSEFTGFFEKLLSDMRGTAEEVNRVTNQPDFQHHIHGLICDTTPRFRSIIEGSTSYTNIRNRILDQLDDDFTAIEKKAQ